MHDDDSLYDRGQVRAMPLGQKIGLAIILIALLIYVYLSWPQSASPSTNVLAIGEYAQFAGEQSIPIFQPVALSKKSRAEIFAIREEFVRQTPQLLKSSYSPTGAVFSGMKSGAKWFSIYGFYYKGRSSSSTEGLSYEGRLIANPFLLIAPEFWGLNIWTPEGVRWSESKLQNQEYLNPGFPFYPIPQEIKWDPSKSRASVRYRLNDFIDNLNQYARMPLRKRGVSFGLTAYNAKDFGFNYLALDSQNAVNIGQFDKGEQPVEITDRIIIMKRLCSPTGECNHMDIPMLDVDKIIIGPLPASLPVNLWYEKPESKNTPPNMVFTLYFE